MNTQLLLLLAAKSMTEAERDHADAYAGPGHSYPLYADGRHLAAAWDLAGHADDPDAVRRAILAFARAHNLMSHLPLDAQHQADRSTITGKALTEAEWLAQYETVEDDGLWVAKGALIEKAWTAPDGTVYIEGWISTPDEDYMGDVTEPEAFTGKALAGYAARRMPLSSEHGRTYSGRRGGDYPIGHMQRVAIVRDGQPIEQATHPTDPAEFEHFPGTGSGTYGRGVINEHVAATSVAKGNIGGFSWIGKIAQHEALPGGGRRILRLDPWLESTIAAYPVNGHAQVLAARSASR